jgi:hypothetical protein
MTIEDIKRHGAILGLEAEVNVRLCTMKNAYSEKNWVLVYSCAVFVQKLSEELRKLNEEMKPPKPCVLTTAPVEKAS